MDEINFNGLWLRLQEICATRPARFRSAVALAHRRALTRRAKPAPELRARQRLAKQRADSGGFR